MIQIDRPDWENVRRVENPHFCTSVEFARRDETKSLEETMGGVDFHFKEHIVWSIIAMAFSNGGKDTQCEL